MAKVFSRKPNTVKPFKYEMTKRKEKWRSINEPLEKRLMIPPEGRPAVVKDLVSKVCYNSLAPMLGFPTIEITPDSLEGSVETLIPYFPPDQASVSSEVNRSLSQESKVQSRDSLSQSQSQSLSYESQSGTLSSSSKSKEYEYLTNKTETRSSTDRSDILSDFVEVEKKKPHDQELMLKHKAILRFLNRPEAEVATWRVKQAKDVSELKDMTLQEQGDFLINKIAVDFCEWMRKLGGDEKSFISEDILKELFQIGMDNPASRAICIKPREKRVLYYRLAELLQVPKKSFHEVLALHLNWDAEVEKMNSKLEAFGKALPKNLRFKTPKNKTAETWLEWNKLSADQQNFADVYSTIKDLRSTKEYCKWLVGHPEYKKPKYLVEQGMFRQAVHERDSVIRQTIRLTKPSHETMYSTVSQASIGYAPGYAPKAYGARQSTQDQRADYGRII